MSDPPAKIVIERKEKMKLYQTLTFDCSTCYGKGYLFYGDNEDYNIDPCDCVVNNVGQLFTTQEAN